jgi:hypothetical protein
MPQIIEVPGHGQVEFPDGMSDQDITSAIQKNLSPPSASTTDKLLGSFAGRMAAGAASPLVGAAQLGAHVGDTINRATGVEPMVSPWIDKQLGDLKASQQRGMKALGNEGFDWAGLAGSLMPTSLMSSGIAKALPTATTLAGKMGVGALQGGAAAAAQPVVPSEGGEFFPEKGSQVGWGVGIGGGIPLVGATIQKGRDLIGKAISPMTGQGRASILQAYQKFLGNNDPKIMDKVVQAAAQAKPGVGGVKPTLGEVIADIPEATGLAAHQKDIAKMPGISPAFQQRAAEQTSARAAEIGSVAQTPAALEQAIRARAQASGPLYEQAGREVITPDAAFRKLADKPSIKSILSRAATLAKEKGDSFKIGEDIAEHTVTSPIVTASGQAITKTVPEQVAKYPVKSLHYMKMAMDDIIKNPERFGIGASEARAIGDTRKEFVQWLGAKSPTYELARETHRIMSMPKNRMEVGQELEKALTTPLGTSERSAMFAKAKEEAPRTIKRATGQQMFDKLEDILTPTELDSVNRVASELARKDAFDRLARGTQLQGKDAIPGDIGVNWPNFLNRYSMTAKFLMQHLAKDAEGKIAKNAAQQYLHPEQFVAGQQPLPPRYQPMIDALMQQAPGFAGATAWRAQP